jgi:hypothetical protein
MLKVFVTLLVVSAFVAFAMADAVEEYCESAGTRGGDPDLMSPDPVGDALEAAPCLGEKGAKAYGKGYSRSAGFDTKDTAAGTDATGGGAGLDAGKGPVDTLGGGNLGPGTTGSLGQP